MGNRGPVTVVDWLASVVTGHRSRPALVAGDRTWTYGEMWERAAEIAHRLLDEPMFGPRSAVGLIGRNTPEYVAAYLGVMRAAGTVVPLNERLGAAEIREQLELVAACGLIDADPDVDWSDLLDGRLSIWPVNGLRGGRPSGMPPVSAAANACILLTSGSTGRPKGVVHTHRALLHSALRLAGALPFGPGERSVGFLPFFASMPEQVLPALLSGGALETIDRFDPERISRACRTATCFDAVPTIMARLLDEADHDALRRLRWICFASEPMPVALLERWWETLPEVATHQIYGMTECLPITHAGPVHLRAKPRSVGLPYPTSELAVIGADGQRLPHGVSGEVACRTPALMAGYLGDPDATGEVMTASGAIRTGDLGELDEDGALSLTGRLKDLIISGGLNVAPAEVEAAACRHPAVASAVVVGIPDPRWGETPVVVAVAMSGSPLRPSDLLSFCRTELSGFKRPSGAALVDRLPLTGIGKSAKSVVRDRILNGEITLVRSG
jgi:acyl-CoA synthetase (AMP-forming)/AMP-acid ligase II